MQTIEVTNCAECPFKVWYQLDKGQAFICSDTMNNIVDDVLNKTLNEECPLKQQSITVKLKEDESSERNN